MEKQLEQIRDAQKETWNKASPGWKKWDDLMVDFLKPQGDEIIQDLHLKDTDTVLDVAAGTGEPGLTIASRLKGGKVLITDLSEGMLAIARENAERRGINNIETLVCDVSEIPFPDNSFDAISCRLGYMFFPDMLLATKEMARVLKPGGRIATSVWGLPEKNIWFTTTMGSINKNMETPSPPPGSPGLFRCAKDGLISGLFAEAGLKNISQKEVPSKLNCKTADPYWGFMAECVGPVVSALGKADDITKNKIKTEVLQAINQKYPDGNVSMDSSALVIWGRSN